MADTTAFGADYDTEPCRLRFCECLRGDVSREEQRFKVVVKADGVPRAVHGTLLPISEGS